MSKLETPPGFIMVSLERFEDIQSPARTYWVLPPSAKMVYSTRVTGRLNWTEYWYVPQDATLERISIGKRGQFHRDLVPAAMRKTPEFEQQLVMRLLGRGEAKA